MRPSLPELLSARFYAWELRGRGWLEYPYPVELEPPFRPFPGYALSRPSLDDGHRPSFLGKLLGFSPKAPEIEAEEKDEPPALAFPDHEPLTEFQVSLPERVAVSPEIAERFLLSLAGASSPFAFEILGTSESLRVGLVARGPDAGLLSNELHAFFPEVSVNESPGVLQGAWTEAQGETILVHFALAREFMLPLPTHRTFDPDPLLPFLGALAELAREEAALMQLLFAHAREAWAESVLRSTVTPSGQPFFADFPELTKLAREKVAHPLYAVCLRLAAKSRSRDGAWRILRELAGALSGLGDPSSNEFLPLAEEGDEALRTVVERTSRRPGMLLGSRELAMLVHLPGASVRLSKLVRERRRTKAAPESQDGIILGLNTHRGKVTPVRLSIPLRLRHLHVIGASGTGKSSLLLDLITQDIEAGQGVAVLDPHGDLVDELLGRIPEERVEETILFDPGDAEHPIAWNILEAHSELERTLLASDLVGLFRRFTTSWGDQMTSVLANAILVLLDTPGATLLDLRKFLADRSARTTFLSQVEDEYLVSYWRHEAALGAGKSIAAILTRLDGFLRSRTVRAILAAQGSRLDLRDVMDRGAIFLAKLSLGAIGEENAALLGSLLVSKLHQVALSRQELRREARRPFFLYADECQEFATPSMAGLLSGTRKYGLGLVLAHQELRQLEARAPEVASALLANAATRVIFRVGDKDARTLAEGLSFFEADDLRSLGVGEAVARIENAAGDTNLRTRLLPEMSPEPAAARREAIIRWSRERYAARRVATKPSEGAGASPREAGAPEGLVMPPAEARPDERPFSAPRPPQRTEAPPPSSIKVPETKATPPLGRGGPEHQYLQELVKRWGEEHGLRTTIEKQIPGGSVDVAFEGEGWSLACEISITSTVEQEVGNVEKCLRAGFGEVAVLSLKRSWLTRLQKALAPNLSPEDLSRVHLFSPEEFMTFLDAKPPLAETKVVGGYKVKVTRRPVSEADRAARARAISEVIAKRLRGLQGEEK